jgi:hypothetical protein
VWVTNPSPAFAGKGGARVKRGRVRVFFFLAETRDRSDKEEDPHPTCIG